MRTCERCQKNPATIHVTEVVHPEVGDAAAEGVDGASPPVREEHLCEHCAQSLDLPHQPTVVKKDKHEIWKLLQASAQRSRRESGIACPDCGMTLLEFRQRGRLGCPRDYTVFAPQTRELLERIHGATQHEGRGPGHDEATVSLKRRRGALQKALDEAIREEAYEQAARLRDELKGLEGPSESERG
jgi:protein arginine kinase activator